MHEQTFTVEDGAIHCAACEKRIGLALGRVPGVSDVQASARTQQVRVRFDPAQLSVDQVEAKLADIGFAARSVAPRDPD